MGQLAHFYLQQWLLCHTGLYWFKFKFKLGHCTAAADIWNAPGTAYDAAAASTQSPPVVE